MPATRPEPARSSSSASAWLATTAPASAAACRNPSSRRSLLDTCASCQTAAPVSPRAGRPGTSASASAAESVRPRGICRASGRPWLRSRVSRSLTRSTAANAARLRAACPAHGTRKRSVVTSCGAIASRVRRSSDDSRSPKTSSRCRWRSPPWIVFRLFQEAPAPKSSRSTRATASPRCAASHATAAPWMPPPTTTTSHSRAASAARSRFTPGRPPRRSSSASSPSSRRPPPRGGRGASARRRPPRRAAASARARGSA